MTEKKFTIHNKRIKESGEVLTVDMVCEMLNDFYEENKQLKHDVLGQSEEIEILSDKNEQLKKENKKLKQALYIEEKCAEEYNMDAMNYETLYKQQKEINELLKKELNEFKQLDIPIDKIEDTVRDGRGRIIRVYYNG